MAAAPIRAATATTLAGLAALRVAWGLGATWPYADAATLSDRVVGADAVPSPPACFAVAGLLGIAAALVRGAPQRWPVVNGIGRAGVASVLAVRGVLGVAGRTDRVVPGSISPAFRRRDRFAYAPLCLRSRPARYRVGRAHPRRAPRTDARATQIRARLQSRGRSRAVPRHRCRGRRRGTRVRARSRSRHGTAAHPRCRAPRWPCAGRARPSRSSPSSPRAARGSASRRVSRSWCSQTSPRTGAALRTAPRRSQHHLHARRGRRGCRATARPACPCATAGSPH